MLLDCFLQDSHDECIERCFIFLGPARQLFVENRRHANLKVNHGFWHGWNSSAQMGPEPNPASRPRYQGPMVASDDTRVGACIGIVPENFQEPHEFLTRIARRSPATDAEMSDGITSLSRTFQGALRGESSRSQFLPTRPTDHSDSTSSRRSRPAGRGARRDFGSAAWYDHSGRSLRG
jgi:hypothetical protein